jgi:hypothetical protein
MPLGRWHIKVLQGHVDVIALGPKQETKFS